MESQGQPPNHTSDAPVDPAGELVVQNGKQSGTRQTLSVPTTFVGRAASCDIRLNVDGVDPLHCCLVHGPDGLVCRDLQSTGGTLVNGQRIDSTVLRDGDFLEVGRFQFVVKLPPQPPRLKVHDDGGESFASLLQPHAMSADKEAARIQVAAVAAQQIALSEEEDRLYQQRNALQRQEEQLSAHLEEKRRELVQLSERLRSERQGLDQDQNHYQSHLEKVTGSLSQAQRQVLENQQKLAEERQRIAAKYRRLRQRWHQHLLQAKQKLVERERELSLRLEGIADGHGGLKEQAQAIDERRRQYNADYELGRREMKAGWERLREAQKQWRQRRSQERTILNSRGQKVQEQEAQWSRAEARMLKEKQAWVKQRKLLQEELEGLDHRVRNQRAKIAQQQEEIQKLDAQIHAKRASGASEEDQAQGKTPGTALVPMEQTPSQGAPLQVEVLAVTASAEPSTRGKGGKKNKSKKEPIAPPPAAAPGTELAQERTKIAERVEVLQRLAGDLADQRLQLLEQWQRLVETHQRWQTERQQTITDLEGVARRLHQQVTDFRAREQTLHEVETNLQNRQQELHHLQQQLTGLRTRLRARETTWEGERDKILAEVKHREALAEQQLTGLADLRQRWGRRRKLEVEHLKGERQACANLRQEGATLREEWLGKHNHLEEEKRVLTEKALALEQYRQEVVLRGGANPVAERRIERLRRRWITHNSQALRVLVQERETLQEEIKNLEALAGGLERRAEEITRAETILADRVTAWEHKQTLAQARQDRLQQELQTAESLRLASEQQVARLQDEMEKIARNLIQEPEMPALTDKAA